MLKIWLLVYIYSENIRAGNKSTKTSIRSAKSSIKKTKYHTNDKAFFYSLK